MKIRRGQRRTLRGFFLCLVGAAGGLVPAVRPASAQAASDSSALRYFGYYGWYPEDVASSNLYARTAGYTNLVAIRIPPADVSVCQACEAAAIRASTGVHTIFDLTDLLYTGDGPSYRQPYESASLFATWWRANGSAIDARTVAALYPADEPVLRCSDLRSTDFPDLDACLQPFYEFVHLVHQAARAVPLAVSLGRSELPLVHPDYARTLDRLGVRWIGYHDYGVADPLRDPTFRANVAAVKALLTGEQELILVGDGWFSGLPLGRYGYVAWADYQVACEEGAVALIEFAWPSWLQSGTWLHGASELPASVLAVHRCIGSRILAGPGSCSGCWPRRPARRLHPDP